MKTKCEICGGMLKSRDEIETLFFMWLDFRGILDGWVDEFGSSPEDWKKGFNSWGFSTASLVAVSFDWAHSKQEPNFWVYQSIEWQELAEELINVNKISESISDC
jgi:hypothetical protein